MSSSSLKPSKISLLLLEVVPVARLLLRLLSPSSSDSILPFIPRPCKYLALIIVLINVRSWPFVWHIRVFVPLLQIYCKCAYQFLTFKSKGEKKKYIRSLGPVGENPLTKENVWRSWASTHDSDWNVHLSNSSYAKSSDGARLKTAFPSFLPFIRDGGHLALGETHFKFIQEIPMNKEYEVRTKLGCWDQKWIYIIDHYVIPLPNKSDRDDITPMSPVDLEEAVPPSLERYKHKFPFPHSPNTVETPATLMSSTSPVTKGPSRGKYPRKPVVLEDGSILACTAVSLVCCKYGRSTVPPALALAVSGFLLSDDEWDTLESLRANKVSGRGNSSANEVKRLLRGGWRDVVAESTGTKLEGEMTTCKVEIGKGAWWDQVMQREGVQEKVTKFVASFSNISEGMDQAANSCWKK